MRYRLIGTKVDDPRWSWTAKFEFSRNFVRFGIGRFGTG